MKLITAIVRPEKVMDVIKALEQEGYFAFSKWAISGRGKEKGIQVGDVLYQEMAKNMLYITVGDKEKDEVVDIIINSAHTEHLCNVFCTVVNFFVHSVLSFLCFCIVSFCFVFIIS